MFGSKNGRQRERLRQKYMAHKMLGKEQNFQAYTKYSQQGNAPLMLAKEGLQEACELHYTSVLSMGTVIWDLIAVVLMPLLSS